MHAELRAILTPDDPQPGQTTRPYEHVGRMSALHLIAADWCDDHGEYGAADGLREMVRRGRHPYTNVIGPACHWWHCRDSTDYPNYVEADEFAALQRLPSIVGASLLLVLFSDYAEAVLALARVIVDRRPREKASNSV